MLQLSNPEIRNFQLKRIRIVCRQAWEHCEFYRQRLNAAGVQSPQDVTWEEFERIPVLTKDELREQGPSMLNGRFSRDQLRKSATGGTTQSPTEFYLNYDAFDRRWAATYEWDSRIGFHRGLRAACLWGATQDFDMNPSWKRRMLNRFVTRMLFLPASPLNDATMADYYERLCAWKPNQLQAYPTPLAIFSAFLLRRHLALNIPVVSVTAEPLQPAHADLIEQAFGTRPYNWYGAREMGRIATECHCHDGMHINAYGVYLEVTPDHTGTDSGIGRIVLTDLWNLGMPMIRYEIGDLGAMTSGQCQCGSQVPRLLTVSGRVADVFINSAGQRIPGVALTNRIVRDNLEFREVQFVQHAIGKFSVLIVPGAQWNGDASCQGIRTRLSEFMQETIDARIDLVESIPREPSGKVRFCKCLIAP